MTWKNYWKLLEKCVKYFAQVWSLVKNFLSDDNKLSCVFSSAVQTCAMSVSWGHCHWVHYVLLLWKIIDFLWPGFSGPPLECFFTVGHPSWFFFFTPLSNSYKEMSLVGTNSWFNVRFDFFPLPDQKFRFALVMSVLQQWHFFVKVFTFTIC